MLAILIRAPFQHKGRTHKISTPAISFARILDSGAVGKHSPRNNRVHIYIHTQTHYNHRNDGTVRARTSNCVRLLLAAATPLIPACLSVPPGLPLPADTITAGTFEKRRRSTQETSCCFEALRAAMAYVCMVTRWSPIRVQLQAYSILPLKVHKN